MTLVDAQTGEIMDPVARSTADEARQRAERIRSGMLVIAEWQTDVIAAYAARDWESLGYSSWNAYLDGEFGEHRVQLPRDQRAQIMAAFRDAGLSNRAIASATGVSEGTVRNALKPGAQSYAPAPAASAPEPQPAPWRNTDSSWPAAPAPSPLPAPEPEPTPRVQGTDGKSYSSTPSKGASSKPRRSSLSDAAQRSGWEFRKSVERLERIADDDRFGANKEQVAAHLRGHLSYAIEVCTDLLNRLDQE